MSQVTEVRIPFTEQAAIKLHAGDIVSISGDLLTARDAAHKRLVALLERGERLPIELQDQIVYYVGPAPARPGQACGPAGPTTSYRMDPYTPALLEHGLRGMIGKGLRSAEVIESMKVHKAVYFAAVGGAAALLARHINSCEVLAYGDLGTEAIHRLKAERFPAIVAIDVYGNNLYESEPPKYAVRRGL
jgi:fumarate hydratase subunit beta